MLIWVASGGPEIAFRGGRVDATEPNAPGVPQPQEGLDSHIASFARQGFTQTEMIGLVACGCVLSLNISILAQSCQAHIRRRATCAVPGYRAGAERPRQHPIRCAL
jgi:hypothetical protein